MPSPKNAHHGSRAANCAGPTAVVYLSLSDWKNQSLRFGLASCRHPSFEKSLDEILNDSDTGQWLAVRSANTIL